MPKLWAAVDLAAPAGGEPKRKFGGHSVMKPTTLDAARTHHSLSATQAGTGRLQGTFNLDEGPVTLIAPATLSEGSCTALADFFELFLRRAKSDAAATGVFPLRRKTVE
jgi:polyisoprenoid-binding protein YceI